MNYKLAFILWEIENKKYTFWDDLISVWTRVVDQILGSIIFPLNQNERNTTEK